MYRTSLGMGSVQGRLPFMQDQVLSNFSENQLLTKVVTISSGMRGTPSFMQHTPNLLPAMTHTPLPSSRTVGGLVNQANAVKN